MIRTFTSALVVVCALVATACSRPSERETTVQVFAAASLTESFAAIEEAFEAEYNSIDIVLNLAGSSTLANQIVEGAPADVFAAANNQTMSTLQERALLATAPVPFATNSIAVVVPTENPGGVASLTDLSRPEITVSRCALQVPCGLAAAQLLGRANVHIDSPVEESNVKASLRRVEQAEVDAGVVYLTDALSSDDVVTIELDPAVVQTIDYPIAVLDRSAVPGAAAAFIDFVVSAKGADALRSRGFGTP